MKVVESDLAAMKLRTLHAGERNKMWSWYDLLGQWETDEFTRSISRLLPGYQDVYILEPSSGPSIFFRLGKDVITILDIAHPETIQMFASCAEQGRELIPMAAKELIEPVFDLGVCRGELDGFQALLDSKSELSEREIQEFLKGSQQLTLLLGSLSAQSVPLKQIGFEFPVFQDFVADIIVGNQERRAYCLIELEDAAANSLFTQAGKKATREWGKRFEHCFSQLVDWFHLLDDVKNTERFARDFGHGHVTWEGMLIVGRSTGLTAAERSRLLWRADRVTINSHKITCMTYDDVCVWLNDVIEHYAAAARRI